MEIIAGMQEKNERSIEALAAMQVRTFELVQATNESVQTMAKNADRNIQAMAEGIDRTGRNMQVLIQFAHRHEDWLEQLEKRNGVRNRPALRRPVSELSEPRESGIKSGADAHVRSGSLDPLFG